MCIRDSNYTIVVTNNGPQDAPNVRMIDSLPEGATLVSVVPGAPTCTVANGQITCNLGTVPAFGSVTIHVQIMAPPVCPNTIINHATVLGSGVDPDPQNNVSKVTTVIECGGPTNVTVSYTHLRAHETVLDLVCRFLL